MWGGQEEEGWSGVCEGNSGRGPGRRRLRRRSVTPPQGAACHCPATVSLRLHWSLACVTYVDSDQEEKCSRDSLLLLVGEDSFAFIATK